MAFNKKAFSFTISLIFGLITLGAISFGLTYYFVNINQKNVTSFATLSDKETFIRQRTFSLKFNTKDYIDPISGSNIRSSLYGTSWIFNKVLNEEVYYLATNVHVISNAISLSAGVTNNYVIADYIDSIELGYPKNPAVVSSTNDLSSEKITNKVNFPKISYTATFVEDKATYPIPASISQNPSFYTYAMSDFAILEFNFSKASQNFKNFLQYYNLSPTKFFDPPLGTNNLSKNSYYIGGYPFLEEINRQIGTWRFGHSINQNVSIVSGTIISNIPQPASNKLGILLPNNITNPPSNDASRYFQNISNQVLIPNLSLTGGSSGSMVINDSYEVVGIYWGSYSGGNNVMGAFDILNTNDYKTNFNNRPGPFNYKGYNRIVEANNIIKL